MIKVACIGDSITWGFTLLNPFRQSYPAVLQTLLGPGYEVKNFGHNDAAARFDSDTPYVHRSEYSRSLSWEPDIVIIMLGTNDTKRYNWDPEVFRRDYSLIVDSYMELPSQPRVILVGPIRIFQSLNVLPWSLNPETMEEGVRPIVAELALEKGLQYISLQDLLTDSSYYADGIHPHKEGARMIAEAIYNQF